MYVRPFANSPDQQISVQTITSINQLTQPHNHNILNSTHSSLNTYSIEQQATTKVINSETTPTGTKHYSTALISVRVASGVSVLSSGFAELKQLSHIPFTQSHHFIWEPKRILHFTDFSCTRCVPIYRNSDSDSTRTRLDISKQISGRYNMFEMISRNVDVKYIERVFRIISYICLIHRCLLSDKNLSVCET